jgi:hypothetical protein
MSLVRSSNYAKAKAVLDQGLKNTVALRLATVLDLAETLAQQGQAEEALSWLRHAVTLLGPLRMESSTGERERLLELVAITANPAEMEQFTGKVLPAQSPAAERAALAAFRRSVASASGPLDSSVPAALGAATAPASVAAFLVGRHNARSDGAVALSWAEAQPEPLRAFAALGAALGTAEARRAAAGR